MTPYTPHLEQFTIAQLHRKDASERALKKLLTGCVRMRETSQTACLLHGKQRVLPTVWIDATERPDIRDLPRAHRQEPTGGDVRTAWVFALSPNKEACAVLSCTMLAPARCRFKLAFEVPRDNAFLLQLAQTGVLVIATQDPRTTHTFLVVEVDQTGLLNGLIACTAQKRAPVAGGRS
jgi:hypothetical protein